MKRKQKSKIICKNLMRKFDYLSSQEDVLVSVIMDSLKEIKKIEEAELELDNAIFDKCGILATGLIPNNQLITTKIGFKNKPIINEPRQESGY